MINIVRGLKRLYIVVCILWIIGVTAFVIKEYSTQTHGYEQTCLHYASFEQVTHDMNLYINASAPPLEHDKEPKTDTRFDAVDRYFNEVMHLEVEFMLNLSPTPILEDSSMKWNSDKSAYLTKCNGDNPKAEGVYFVNGPDWFKTDLNEIRVAMLFGWAIYSVTPLIMLILIYWIIIYIIRPILAWIAQGFKDP